MLAADYPLLNVFWTTLWFFLFFLWVWTIVVVMTDVFRSPDLGGFAKAMWFLFVLFLPVIGVVTYLIARRARGVRVPLFTAWLNQNTPSHVRATVNSVVGQADGFGEVLGGPALGAVGSLASLRAAFATSAGLLLPALALYAHALRRGGREPVP